MNYLQRLEYWGETHHPKYLDLLRIALGIFLCFKGVEFANNTVALNQLVSGRVSFNSMLWQIIVHYILFAHIVGGFMIAAGLLTRVACIAQIPVLLGALIFVRWDAMNYFSGFLVALLTFILVCYFLIIGSGPWSLDRALDQASEEKGK